MNQKSIDITLLDCNEVFLHYTNKNNLDSIFKDGLIPTIGNNSKNIELNKKIFFTKGFDNTLILMDSWIKWLVLRPKSDFIYKCGYIYMTNKIFPRFVVDLIFKNSIENNSKINYACKKLDDILENSVFLKLNLIEKIDFNYNDIDEVKKQPFSRKQLNYIYSYGNDSNDITMELWNMHTIVDKIIEKEKLEIVSINNSYSAKKIVMYLVKNSKMDLNEKCPFLLKYVKFANKL